jgi:hypothetical protein
MCPSGLCATEFVFVWCASSNLRSTAMRTFQEEPPGLMYPYADFLKHVSVFRQRAAHFHTDGYSERLAYAAGTGYEGRSMVASID